MTLEQISEKLTEIKDEMNLINSGYYKDKEELEGAFEEIEYILNPLIDGVNLEIWKQSINNLK